MASPQCIEQDVALIERCTEGGAGRGVRDTASSPPSPPPPPSAPAARAAVALVTLALAAALGAPTARAQSGRAVPQAPVLHYEHGRLVEAYLPFGQAFAVQGPLLTSGGRADVVLARVWQTDSRPASDGTFHDRAAAPIDSACWVRAPESDATQFDLAFEPLRLGRRYRFELLFAKRYAPATLREAVARATATVIAADTGAGGVAGGGIAPSTGAARAAFLCQIARALKARQGALTPWLRTAGEGDCAVDSTPPPLAIPAEALDALASAVARAAALERDAADARATESALLDSLGSVPADTLALLEAHLLRAAEHRRGARATLPFDSADAIALVAAARARDASLLSATAAARLQRAIARPAPAPPLGTADARLLARVLAPVEALRGAERDEARVAESLDAERKRESEAWKGVEGALQHGYLPVARAGGAATAWGAETEVRKLQIGTALGGAYARLGIGSPAADGDGFLFAAVRFYLAPVDRSRPAPWSSALARFSIDVGSMVRSTLHHRGEEQRSAFAGLSPTLGVSWDARRFLALSAGMVVYRRPAAEGSDGGRTLRAAPYIGVSSDLDAFNKLHDLLK